VVVEEASSGNELDSEVKEIFRGRRKARNKRFGIFGVWMGLAWC
jgi:hypothetical protein